MKLITFVLILFSININILDIYHLDKQLAYRIAMDSMQDERSEIDSIVYEASTRGFYERVVINHDSLYITNQRNNSETKSFKTNSEDWAELNSAISNVDLDAISSFNAPTDKRMVDGAAYAHLIVHSNGSIYESQQFDHKFPPKQLAPLTEIIYRMVNMASKE